MLVCTILLILIRASQEYELVFVQALWRHGDRAAQNPFKSDKITENDWKSIGSGTGQLTYKGIKQQVELGRAIRKRYIDPGFLPDEFDDEITKFRSTNRNRTILSAEANFLGMYPLNPFGKMVRFPIFVAQNYSADCVNNVMCECQRRQSLQKIGKTSDEFREILEDPTTIELFSNLSRLTGETITAENFWRVPDALRCEKEHFPAGSLNSWYSESLLEQLEVLNTKINRFTSGIYRGRVGEEISKIRSGPIVSEIFGRIQDKSECLKRPKCISKLRYYAYSSHDMTLFSFLHAFGLQNLTSSEVGGWPPYASAIFIEIFVDRRTRIPFFKVIYRSKNFENVTSKIPGCKGNSICPLEVFERIEKDLSISVPISQYCQSTIDLQ